MNANNVLQQMEHMDRLVTAQRAAGIDVDGPMQAHAQSFCSQIAGLRSCTIAEATALTEAISRSQFTQEQRQTLCVSVNTRTLTSVHPSASAPGGARADGVVGDSPSPGLFPATTTAESWENG